MSNPAFSADPLLELVRSAEPLTERDWLAIEDSAASADAERLLQRILASDRNTTPALRRVREHRRLVVSAASGVAVVAAAVLAVFLLTAGSRPSVAFAGWAARPSDAPDGQLGTAETECQRSGALRSLAPALVDARGPYTLLVYAANGGSACVTGPELLSPTGEPPIVPFGSFLSASAAARHAAAGPGTTPGSQVSGASAPLAADAIRSAVTGNTVTRESAPKAAYSLDIGQAGTNVTAVTLVLDDGTRVAATVSHGWFAAWWPGSGSARSAEITGASGNSTQQFGAAARAGSATP
jgi:hypothetical protein